VTLERAYAESSKACANEDANVCFSKCSFFFRDGVYEYQQNFVSLLEVFNNPLSQERRILDVNRLFTVFVGFSLDEK
jgi:hypothetical protein